jgi:hypothetical protein
VYREQGGYLLCFTLAGGWDAIRSSWFVKDGEGSSFTHGAVLSKEIEEPSFGSFRLKLTDNWRMEGAVDLVVRDLH